MTPRALPAPVRRPRTDAASGVALGYGGTKLLRFASPRAKAQLEQLVGWMAVRLNVLLRLDPSLGEAEGQAVGWDDLRGPFGKRKPRRPPRPRSQPPQMCASPTEDDKKATETTGAVEDEAADATEAAAVTEGGQTGGKGDGGEGCVDALRRIFIGTTFGAQVAALTVLFAAFLVWSSTALNDDFWTTPF
jgi:hypothetical protein